ncbi:MAG: sugar phosphate isomerase/epimerase [Clostridiaceae bacterium]|jgi:sugar phosphate isomerase/epimerase|nr:sugar phosphate isomerase/epimerase [Clostridiaceae bacterium]
MYLGFLTACLPKVPLEEKAAWAAEKGFKALEIACWPRLNDRDYASSDIDVANLTQAGADKIRAMMDSLGLTISSLAYYDNNLDADLAKRAFVNNHTRQCIRAAKLLGVPAVGTFVGRNSNKTIAANFDAFETVFGAIVREAEAAGVQIIIENCPMEGWQVPLQPGTISFSPELWQEMFRRVPNPNFGLNFDPSHLFYQLIDPLPLIGQFKDRILHVHAKDAELFPDKLAYYGIYNKLLPSSQDNGFWRFRMPGLGQVDLAGMVRELKKISYSGVISIEHEDPLYEASEAKIYEGLELGLKHMTRLLA